MNHRIYCTRINFKPLYQIGKNFFDVFDIVRKRLERKQYFKISEILCVRMRQKTARRLQHIDKSIRLYVVRWLSKYIIKLVAPANFVPPPLETASIAIFFFSP